MNKQEALKILELNQDATEEQIKKQYKKLAAKNHPDVNKESGAEDKFKKINEAFQFLSNPPPQQPQNIPSPSNIDDFFNSYVQQHVRVQSKIIRHPTVKLQVKLTFKESVLGCKKSFTYNKFEHCKSCEGTGQILTSALCTGCNGKGAFTSTQGNMFFRQTCTNCNGAGRKNVNCDSCKGEGGGMVEKTLEVKLTPGLQTSNTVRLQGAGNYCSDGRGRGYEDVFIHVFVETVENMQIDGINVLSSIDISLLEALTGVTKKVNTVSGEVDLSIPALSKHSDCINIKNAGVGEKGDHVFKLNVEYPKENIDKLINKLKKM